LIDVLVFGRVSFLGTPELTKALLRDHPHLLERLDQDGWMAIVRSALEGNKCFARIQRKGFDADGKKLEDTWYYETAQGASY
jgi:hypothetical protein